MNNFPPPTRASDEKLLAMLAMRARGEHSGTIGRALGCASSYVRATLTKIDRALAESEQ